jgi:hypothetical protein
MFICIYVTLVIGSQVCCQYLVCITCVCVCVCVLYVCIYECMLLLPYKSNTYVVCMYI